MSVNYCPECMGIIDTDETPTTYAGLSLLGFMLSDGTNTIRLTKNEASLMRQMMRTGKASNEALQLRLNENTSTYRLLLVFMCHLRRKLKTLSPSHRIKNTYGWGYEITQGAT